MVAKSRVVAGCLDRPWDERVAVRGFLRACGAGWAGTKPAPCGYKMATLRADVRPLREDQVGDSQAFRRGASSGSYLSIELTIGPAENTSDLRSVVRRGLRLPQK